MSFVKEKGLFCTLDRAENYSNTYIGSRDHCEYINDDMVMLTRRIHEFSLTRLRFQLRKVHEFSITRLCFQVQHQKLMIIYV